jgi:transglutaminase-like putative cysteine protease
MTHDIVHRTTYHYSEPVTISHHAARLKPRLLPRQQRSSFALEISPTPNLQHIRTDYFGNRVCFFSIQQLHPRLEIVSRSRVTVLPTTSDVIALSPPWEEVAGRFMDPVSPEVICPYEFSFDSPLLQASPVLADYARASFQPGTPLLAGAQDLTRRIYQDFRYDPVATTISTPLEEVMTNRGGVCQDFAHIAIASLRSLGLAARYVSGYLCTHPPAGTPKFVGADASHAWFSIYCPGSGWVDFDPTNNIMAGEEHITVAYGRDFADVSPVSGILVGGGQHQVSVAVDVTPCA